MSYVSQVLSLLYKALSKISTLIEQLNAAKGRLRSLLHIGLFKPNETLLDAKCDCKEITLFGFEKTLWDLNVWPLEKYAQKKSISALLDNLNSFNYKPLSEVCIKYCRQNFNHLVLSTRSRVESYFQGLCMDCMNHTNLKSGDTDADYWDHNNYDPEDKFLDCRIRHKEPTWYFSFMGRREERDQFVKRKRA